jgi:hypothetical protein
MGAIMEDMGEYEIELERCIWKDCKGDLIELESGTTINWVMVVYQCTRCGRQFTVKIET